MNEWDLLWIICGSPRKILLLGLGLGFEDEVGPKTSLKSNSWSGDDVVVGMVRLLSLAAKIECSVFLLVLCCDDVIMCVFVFLV